MTSNTSKYSDTRTANTCLDCASQRAENLAILGVKSVLELCVGPSLRVLEREYANHGIIVTGNDIDPRWRDYYTKGKWLIGDATKLDTSGFDAVVVAPPLSRGCSGKREDSLSIEQVTPSYYSFLALNNPVVAFVLPGRTLSLRDDRRALHRLLGALAGVSREDGKTRKVELVPLRKKVVKYVDLYVIA